MLLGIGTVGEAGEFAIGAEYAVAGDDEQERILVAGHAHSAVGSWIIYRGSYLSVGAVGAVGNLP